VIYDLKIRMRDGKWSVWIGNPKDSSSYWNVHDYDERPTEEDLFIVRTAFELGAEFYRREVQAIGTVLIDHKVPDYPEDEPPLATKKKRSK
jgi:hypothetical protein